MDEDLDRFVSATRYQLDPRDRIVHVGASWDPFARQNGAPGLVAEQVVGRSLWDFVAGSEVRELYAMIFARVRRHDTQVLLPFRCDSPDRRRFMRLVIHPLGDGGLQLDALLVEEQPRPAVGLLEPDAPRAGRPLRLCSSCKQVEVEPETWLEVEDAAVRLDLLGAAGAPRLVHGVCPSCRRLLHAAAEGEGPSAAER